ncbi:MAG: AIPR family protein [Geminicoccaceae bacterium]
MSERYSGSSEPVVVRFPHSKDDLRRITVRDDSGEYDLYRISPSAVNWPAERIPDRINPRSHDETCLKSKVAADIEGTLRNEPQDFWLANRGGFLLAERVKFDPDRGQLEITITDSDIHGMADGATTNAVIAKLQKQVRTTKDGELQEALSQARFNIDVVVGLTDHERIEKLVQGRNRSVQVKEWSLNDFRGNFDWLKAHIDRRGGPFAGRIGWEENSSAPVSVLELISLMTLFHPEYSAGRRRAPTVAFSSKGTADKRLIDPRLASGYRALEPVLEDILRLHDHVYSGFSAAYEKNNREVHNRGSKLGKRRGTESRSTALPLTGAVSDYRVDKGLIFPLLAAHRSLLHYPSGTAEWRTDPCGFFDEHGSDLVGRLYDEYEKLNGNPASVGKNSSVYETLYEKAENFWLLKAAKSA